MSRTQCFAEKRGSTWRGRYPDADGRLRSTSGYPTRNKALQAARDARAAIKASAGEEAVKAEKAAKGEITLAEWVSEIWPAWDIEVTTRANYSAPIRLFILPAFGDRSLASLRREEIGVWERALIDERGYSVEYIRGTRHRLHTILADAVTAGRLEVNLASRQRGRGRMASQDRARGHGGEDLGHGGHRAAARRAVRAPGGRGRVHPGPADRLHGPAVGRGERAAGLLYKRPRSPPQSFLYPRRMAAGRAERQVLPRAAQGRLAAGCRYSRLAVRTLAAAQGSGPPVPVPAPRRRHQRVRVARGVLVPGREAGHARRSSYASWIFRPAADGVYPAQKRRRGYHTGRWRVHCSHDPFPGIPVPMKGMHRAKAEQLADARGRRSSRA